MTAEAVPEEVTDGERRIVVATDGSEGSSSALEWAVAEARRRNAVLQVVHAWHCPPIAGYAAISDDRFAKDAAEVIEDAVRQATEMDPGVVVKGELIEGRAAHALVELSKHADLLVVGSRGRGGFVGLLLGSVSQECAHHAHCPVVIVRQTKPSVP